jgi:3-oxoacyl-[acyl-carrier protein] reductase
MCRHNVIINNILPGMFHTATIHDRFTALAQANGTSYAEETAKFVTTWNIAAGRFGDPDDLGDFVAMFCSRQANFTVGQSLVIDGGMINALF